MRQNPSFSLADTAAIKQLIRDNPWSTLVSDTSEGLVASHYPVLVDDDREELSVLTHVGRPDDLVHELGQHELLVVIQGPHGYISPSWYDENPAVPTWNFVAAHLRGVPEILSPEENFAVLGKLVDHFEDRVPEPRRMLAAPTDAAYAERIQSGTVGIRLTPTSVTAKAKLSQNRPLHIVDSVIGHLEGDGPYAQPALAALMREARQRRA
ncbi:FMN-binding negative transcriptional regulator [Amnibacterium sp.]|uniref:FMN-binding negative transcriptional regulator n=1 Tax=Amnibacterium sp. TaxID=1872496 RepID=UPI0026304837|nr:FMN-binding negative transcriptional regulator [Amnibacterium sp.]MCU1472167.1 transcriptional regulator [Amnibacterium sp.]